MKKMMLTYPRALQNVMPEVDDVDAEAEEVLNELHLLTETESEEFSCPDDIRAKSSYIHRDLTQFNVSYSELTFFYCVFERVQKIWFS